MRATELGGNAEPAGTVDAVVALRSRLESRAHHMEFSFSSRSVVFSLDSENE